MKTSDQGLTLLGQREGRRLKAYQDTVGVWTIGDGHTGPDVYQGLVWTEEQANAALAEDVKRCEDAINLYCVHTLAQHQFDALVSFTYNVGVTAFRKSTLLRKLNQGDFEGAAKQLDRWHIPPEIISRRNGEREQFLGNKFVART
jgi:lysozyme